MQKLIFAALLSVFAIVSVSAQSRVDNFLGTWKLSKMEGAIKSTGVKSADLNVSQTAGVIKIDRATGIVSNKKAYSRTETSSYKADETVALGLVGGQTGGTAKSRIRFLSANKLRVDNSVGGDFTGFGQREIWSVSADGKTLTIESYFSTRNADGALYSKIIFTKQ